MSALSREIGPRGRADAVVAAAADAPEPSPEPQQNVESVAQLPAAPDADSSTAELNGLRLKELRRQAKAEGAEPEQLEDAADADDPKAAVIELLLALRASAAAGDGTLRAELEGLRLKELRQRARIIYAHTAGDSGASVAPRPRHREAPPG